MRRMGRTWIMWLCLLVVVAGTIVGIAEKAWAVGAGLDGIGLDGEEAKTKEVITGERPTKLKIGIGIGSVVVAILVVKFL